MSLSENDGRGGGCNPLAFILFVIIIIILFILQWDDLVKHVNKTS